MPRIIEQLEIALDLIPDRARLSNCRAQSLIHELRSCLRQVELKPEEAVMLPAPAG